MKQMKRALTIFLILIMLFQSIPIVYATDSISNSTSDETTLSAENGMGQIIENLTEAEIENDNYPDGYSISEITFEGNVANVSVNVSNACKLVVAVYDENTLEMLCSATEKLDASTFNEEKRENIVSIKLGITGMPEHFLAKAFLLDENNNALCKNFVCRTYTTAYEVFMETTPDDFSGKEIVTLDINCDDFGVLVDNVVALEKSEDMTYTYNDGVYTFFNATEEVKNLKTDDIFYCQLSDEIGDFLLIKVNMVKVNGTTVEITEDDEIALGDAFQFIRIDEEADFSDIELTEENLGSALSLQEPEEQIMLMSPRSEVDVSKETTFSTTLNVSYPNSKEENKEAWEKGWEIKGKFGYSLSANIKLYYDIRSGDDFYEFTTSLTHDVDLNVAFTGKIESNSKYFSIDFPTIPIGVFNLDISVYPVLSAEASMTFGGTIEVYNNISFTDGNGLTKINETKWLGGEPELGETEIEFKLGVGVDFDIGFKKGKKDVEGLSKLHASLSASFEGGIKANFKPSLIGVLLDKHHDCAFCLDGSISAFLSGKATLKFKIISENLKWSWDAISLTGTWTVGNYYFSISGNGVKFGFGTCPYISYKVTVNVFDESGNPVKDAVVSTTTGYCDADGDKKYNETSMNTDENGQAVFYFSKGNHEVVSKKNDIGTSGQQFEMLSNEKELYLELFDAEYFNGHWYKVIEEKKTWDEAKSYCENLGGHLGTITSQEEQDFIFNLTKEFEVNGHWLGGTDSIEEGNWTWINSDKWSYTNWDIGEPNNTHQNQHYLHIYGKTHPTGTEGYWDDVENTSHLYFICEWETIPSNCQVMSYRMLNYSLADETQTENEIVVNDTTATRTNALKDSEYILAVIKDEAVEDLFAEENLIYIDQKTAEGTTISFDFVLPEGITDYTVKIFGASHIHTPTEAIKENEITATCTVAGSYDSVTYCSVCGEELSRENIITDALEHSFTKYEEVTAPECGKAGLEKATCDNGCGETDKKEIPALTHKDDNGDYKCDYGCGHEFEKPVDPTPGGSDEPEDGDCDHLCHKGGFIGFIWKIVRFFSKLFKINPVCECGAAHY